MKRIYLVINFIITASYMIFSCSASGPSTKKQMEEQIHQLKEKIKQFPDSSQFYVELGILYQFNDRPEEAIDLLKKAKERFKDDPMVEIWLANAESMMAAKVTDIKEKVKWSQYAITDLDATVNKYPDNWKVRIIRARNSMNWPDMFHRKEVAVQDYEYLLSLAESNPSVIPDSLIPQMYYELGMAYKATGLNQVREKEIWNLLMKNYPESEYAKQLARQQIGQ